MPESDEKFEVIADALLTAVDTEEVPVRTNNVYLLELLAQAARIGYDLRKVEEEVS